MLKQAVGTQSLTSVKNEIDFFTEVFKAAPTELLFLYREPHGYWRSAKKKFGHEDDEMYIHYCRAFNAYKQNGGQAIEYGEELKEFISTHPLLQKVKTDDFTPKAIAPLEGLEEALTAYRSFKEELGT